MKAGELLIGNELRVTRLGCGAMRITGKGIWGEPADRAEAIRVLCAKRIVLVVSRHGLNRDRRWRYVLFRACWIEPDNTTAGSEPYPPIGALYGGVSVSNMKLRLFLLVVLAIGLMIQRTTVTRRDLVRLLVSSAGTALLGSTQLFGREGAQGWIKYAGNPVLGGQYGTCFDICVLREQDLYRMWLSWRPKRSIALTESKDGIHWSAPEIVLSPEPRTGWEDEMNRPVVFYRENEYHMWYTGQANGRSNIGYATSPDGRKWTRRSVEAVLGPSAPWESVAVMCPHVMWDEKVHLWKMWYSGGEQYEPNAIGYATSKDGLRWIKYADNPVLLADPHNEWEKERVTAAQIIRWKGWYYAFYIGFRDIDHAQIGLARSKNGVTGWVRHAGNPIVRPTPDGWDADACYKPYAVYAEGSWRLWYNGRHEHLEQIGLVLHAAEDLGFVAER
jgi:predicted GH43/DUF377 family glycosyl hydrolase